MSLNFTALIQKVPRDAVFTQEGYHVWCGSMAAGDDGRFFLYYSRWPYPLGHYAWVTHSQVAFAVADKPTGPYEYAGMALGGRGGDHWDASTIHNPTVIRADGKYYMYYMGTRGNGLFPNSPVSIDSRWWEYRNNQRIGVAVADKPEGPWTRFDTPLIDVTPGSHDSLMTSNPSVTRGPDNRFYMVYKAVGDGPMPKGGAVVCGVAVADSPLGPFVKQPRPVMVNPEEGWSVEDPYIWYQNGRFHALVKDFQGYFTRQGKNTVALFESEDGLDWEAAEHPFAFDRVIQWDDGEVQRLSALERPQLYLENGVPKVLFCAAAVDDARTICFNVHIPLNG